MKKIFEAGDEELEKKLDRYINKLIFNILSSLREDEGSPGEIVGIVDMEGYSLAQLASTRSKKILSNKFTCTMLFMQCSAIISSHWVHHKEDCSSLHNC